MNFAQKVLKKSTIIFDKVLLRYIEHLLLKEQRKKIQNCLVVYGSKEADRLKDLSDSIEKENLLFEN